MDAQDHQSSGISRGNNEPLSGPQIGPVGYETRCEHLSLQQQHAELKVQSASPTNCDSPILETKHESTHEDAINVQHQQSSVTSRLDYELLDGLELGDVEFQGFTESFSSTHLFPELEEIPCMDLSEARKQKNKRGKNMTEEETWTLLSCKLEGGRFCKGSGGATHWNLISEEIGKKPRSLPSANQCRLRYDTLLKAYKKYKKYCVKIDKTFSEITEEERLDLKLATTLSKEWYTRIDEICNKAQISHKRMKLSSIVCNDFHPLSSHDSPAPNLPAISNGKSFKDATVVLDSACGTVEDALRNVFPVSVFSSWNEDLHSTLLNLVQECSLPDWFRTVKNGKFFGLETIYHRLATVQDREPREILNYVFKLWKLDFVNVVDIDFEEGQDLARIDLWNRKTWYLVFWVYEKIKEVLWKNPHLKTYWDGFPIDQSSLQYIRVLRLVECGEFEHLELGMFPNLRSLTIRSCPKLNLVIGWEVATGLGSLEISWCSAYHDFPNLQYLISLREISLTGSKSIKSGIPWGQLSQFSQCTKLQRITIYFDKIWSDIADLKNLKELKFLEFLSLGGCTFSRIQGLNGLQALTTLDLHFCSLRTVPELGCLKGLTHLDMSDSSVEDVVGVGELHLLTCLDLRGCKSLKWLPFLGHLKALVHLDLRGTIVKEIPGREDLISLKDLRWEME